MATITPAAADALLREALGALDACLAALAQVDERARALGHETEMQHRMMRRYLTDVGLHHPAAAHDLTLTARPAPGPVSIDHEAIYRDEVALQQTAARLHSLHGKVDHLVNVVRAGRAQVLGSDPEVLAAAPWAAAVRAARIDAQEDERARLAREVHDGPAQVLANAILGLEYCEIVATRAPAELEAELSRLRGTMRDGLVEVRRFMFDLRPTTLASLGLNATLARSIADFQIAFGIPVHLALPPQEMPLDDGAQIVVFRVLQECLQNIHKHSQAGTVRVELARQEDGQVRLSVADNGQGFDPQAPRHTPQSGVGLLGMEERAALCGGTLAVEAALGRGTTVILCLPARPDPPAAAAPAPAPPQGSPDALARAIPTAPPAPADAPDSHGLEEGA